MHWEFMIPQGRTLNWYIVGPQEQPLRFKAMGRTPPEGGELPRYVTYVEQSTEGNGQIQGGQEYLLWFRLDNNQPISMLARIGLSAATSQ